MSQLATQFDGAAYSGADALDITDTAAVVLGPLDLQAFDRFGVYVDNTPSGAGAKDLTVVSVEHAPQEGGPWVLINAVTVVANTADFVGLNQQAVKYVRVTAVCAALEASAARFWLCAGGAS